MKRLYLPPPLRQGPQSLTPDREHYLRNVLRLKSGAQIQVFDGTGVAATATAEANGRKLSLTVAQLQPARDTGQPATHLAFALLKGKANEQVLRKATELGATDLWPLYTDHTDVPRKLLTSANGDHQQAIVISACEQCGQNHLPRLHPGQTLDTLLEQAPVAQMLFADMDAEHFPAQLPAADSMVIIGPEGGWSDRELDLVKARAIRRVNLGDLVLRAETAPLVALSMLTMARRHNAV
ncbi:MAG: 16S rRNA (uracil(1498)-N(3))-methyltransferase [Pseudomonadales bacterium]